MKMIYIQTTIEIDEDTMEIMTDNVLDDLECAITDRDLPATKEIKLAVLKEALKNLLEEGLTTE
jgi:hypothetical protein